MSYTTISSYQINDWPSAYGTTGTLAIFANIPFVADDGKQYMAGNGDSLTSEFVTKASISVASTVGTVASFSLPQTDLASPQNAVTYTARIFDSNGSPRDDYPFQNFHLKSTLGNSITYLAFWNDNQQVYRGQLDSVPTTAQMNTAIAAAINAPASTTQNGIGEVSVTPVDTSHPIFVGDNDPRVGKDSADYASLSAAVTAIGSTATDLFITSTFASGASCTVPSTLRLRFMAGGSIVLGSGHTVIVRSDISGWPTKQILSGSGTLSFSGSTQVKSVYSEWWGAVADNSTNCTSAINAALAAIFTAGKGTLQLLAGTYYCGGSINATSGGVIYPPQNSWTNGLNQTMVSISIVGAAKATWGDYGVIGGGTVIRSDVTYSGAIAVPAILSAKVYTTGIAETDFNIIDLHVENVIFRTYDNPSIGGVNLMMARRGSVRNVVADVGVTETTDSSTGPSNPTATVYGVAMPKTPNNGQATIENCIVTGYRFGFSAADHARFVGFNMAARCLYGFVFETATGYATGDLYSYRNKLDIWFIGTKNIINLTLQSEIDITSGTWTQRNVGVDPDVKDDSDITHGSLWYFLEAPSGLSNYPLTYTGLSSVDKTSTYNGKPTTFTHFFTAGGALVNPSHGVMDSAVIGGGGTVTVTLSGGAVFTGSTTYQVVGTNVSNTNAFKIVKASGTQFIITGTASDIIAYIATGN